MFNNQIQITMKNLNELKQAYAETRSTLEQLGKEIEALENEVKYPIYCINRNNKIVKFNGFKGGIVVKQGDNLVTDVVGFNTDCWQPHTDTSVWKQLPVCPKTGFFHKQLVLCKYDSHGWALRFYDAINSCTFTSEGCLNGGEFSEYKAFEGNYPDFMQEAFKTLED